MSDVYFSVFHDEFPEIAKTETRTLHINDKSSTLFGEYALIEMYCNDPECDCRKVMLSILSKREKRVVAVISYGWGSKKFYEEWFGRKDDRVINEIKGVSLNIASPQSEYAPELLQLVKTVVLSDKDYVDRIKRHYKMFKEKIAKMDCNKKEVEVELPGSKLGRNEPCYCGSGKKYKNCCLKLNS